jgi:hypothetical protein
MSFKDLMKSTGIMTSAINTYLLTTIEENDRRSDIHSPSLISKGCLITMIMNKLDYNAFGRLPNEQTKRIFANGDGVHERLQDWTLKSGLGKFMEVALKHPYCGMYGTTDAILLLERAMEVVVGEYKSMNDSKFNNALKGGALIEHQSQATMYTGMLELRRKHLRKKYKTEEDLMGSIAERMRFYRQNYFDHIKDGKKYTRLQKLQHLLRIAINVDHFLWTISKPIKRYTILYENKNTQAFKEFEYTIDEVEFARFVKLCTDTNDWLNKYDKVDKDNIEYFQIKQGILPKRDPRFTKSCDACKYCNVSDFCYSYIEYEGEKDEKVKKDKKKKSGDKRRSKNPLERVKARK